MLIFRTTERFMDHLAQLRSSGKMIGFAPTMGALHEGHVSLLKRTIAENDVSITSIFVNPAQFNDKKDLDRYPRTFESDVEALYNIGTDILFYPEIDEMYPPGLKIPVNVDFGYLLETMEAVSRKGHFEGVVKVMKRLLDIVQPDNLYMGQKDYQQFLIVRRMIEALKIKTKIIMCPTVREADGLAMSSRNTLLSNDERKAASHIPKVLFKAQKQLRKKPYEEIKKQALDALSNIPSLHPEYFEIVDAETLKPVNKKNGRVAICLAVKVGAIRLIDNLVIS